MKVRSIILFALCSSLIGCGLGNQNISTVVEIENGSIKGVQEGNLKKYLGIPYACLLYTSPSPRDGLLSRMPSSA